MRIKKGLVASPSGKGTAEVFLIRPPLYVTAEEKEKLDALVVSAGLAPPSFLTRGRRARARDDAYAELCRRTILSVLLGEHRFPEPMNGGRGTNFPLRALLRQKTVGGRFRCRACESRGSRKRARFGVILGARLREERKTSAELRRRIRELESLLRRSTAAVAPERRGKRAA